MRERRDRHPVNTQHRQMLPICKRGAIRKGGLVIRRAAWAAPRAVLGFASVASGLGRGLSGLRRLYLQRFKGPPHPSRPSATGTSPNRACRLTFSTPRGSRPPPESPLQHPVIYGAFQASALATAHPPSMPDCARPVRCFMMSGTSLLLRLPAHLP
jgi:hypothetical protein